MSELEDKFKDLAKQVNNHIKAAASELKKARNLAKKEGINQLNLDEYSDEELSEEELSEEEYELVEDFMDSVNIYPLFNELTAAGWRTSSIGC